MDCIEGMKKYPDNYFDLAIVDPPYFEGPNKRKFYGKSVSSKNIKRKEYPIIKNWKPPEEDYFIELNRVSVNQIIWGCNYYDYPFGPGRFIWDKVNGNSSFSDAEISYCSMFDSVRIFRYMWNGMLQGKSINEGHIQQGNKQLNEKRIHQTQKPVKLYQYILQKWGKEGDKILDTHVGSGSSRIAAHSLGFNFTGFELDKVVFNLSEKRFKQITSQLKIF